MRKMSRNFKQRLLFSMLAVLLLLISIYFSFSDYFKWIFISLCVATFSTVVWEFYHIARAKGLTPLTNTGVVSTAAYVLASYWSTQIPSAEYLPEVVLGITLVLCFLYYFVQGTDPFVNLGVTLFGLFYLTIPLTCVILINYYFPKGSTQDGRWWLIYLFAVTKMTDVGAYFCGKLFGRHRLAPYISPKKTWEGAVGGLITALVTSVGLYACMQHFFVQVPLDITLEQSIWLGLSISILGQFGDLAESLLKRDLGVKDSNHLPGLGGMLDSVDSLVFTTPFVYLFLKMTHPL